MNLLQAGLLALLGIGLALLVSGRRGPGRALAYARWVLLLVAGGLTLLPFVWLVCAAIKDPSQTMASTFLPPVSQWSAETINLTNFRLLFKGEASMGGTVYFWTYVLNSVFLASASTVIQLVLGSAGGYALAVYDFKGRKALMLFMLGTMMIPGMILLAPIYRLLFAFGWLDTWLCLLVPGAVSAFGIFLFRQGAQQVPRELIEAARLDGASELRIWWQVVMPLLRPISGAFCLITFLGSWNNFLAPQVYISSQDLLTLPVVLNQYLGVYSKQYGVFLAGTLIAIIPPAALFIALQREFVSGLTSGAVKG